MTNDLAEIIATSFMRGLFPNFDEVGGWTSEEMRQAHLEAAQAVLTALREAGYAVVPVEPTVSGTKAPDRGS